MRSFVRISFYENSVVLTLALLFAAACGDGSHSQATSPQSFALRFQAVNAAQDVSCDKALLNLGTGKVKAQLQDFALYIHGLTFIKADGTTVEATLETNEWQAENVALLDFQDKADSCLGENKPTHVVIKGSIPNQEEFRALRFTLGVPPHLNHVDPASVKAPLNATHMFWSWQSGYKSMRLD
ncbi:MAG: metallo-mystery pair system four-Cys motif protein, partial [Hyphomicrobiales bacterium]